MDRKAQLQGARIQAPSTQKTATPRSSLPAVSDTDRKASLMASRGSALPFQIPQPPTAQLAAPVQQQKIQEQENEEDEQEDLEQERSSFLRRAIQWQLMQLKEAAEDEIRDQLEEQIDKQKNKLRAEVKKKAKAAARRGMIFILDAIAAAFDLSSSGISFIVDIFIYLFSFAWLNLEMIYGTHFAKGKSLFISPLSWEPIPMPVDPNAFWLQGLVVTADIALGVAVVVMGAGGMCILHDYVALVSDPVTVGTALASGNVGDMCLGGIMSLVINGL